MAGGCTDIQTDLACLWMDIQTRFLIFSLSF